MSAWLFTLAMKPDTFPLLKAADFWFGAVGFIITICGFGIAWFKLARVQAAAKAAEEALDTFRFRVQRYEATSDLSIAQYALTTIGKVGDSYNSRDVVEMLSDVSQALGRVESVVRTENLEIASNIGRSITSVEKTIRRLEREGAPHNQVSSADLRKLARATIVILHSSKQVLQDKMI